jgi:predicted GNAT superfamily acetyltransferase
MNKEFIPYDQALALKELEFDEPCFAFYDESLYFPNNENQYGTFCNQKLDASSCSAPTYSQAFRWFREKYNLHQFIEYIEVADRYDWWVRHYMQHAKTYEEAELACLKKLIEIVKGGNK